MTTNVDMVVSSLERRRRATLTEIIKDAPDLTRMQVLKALQNAARNDYAHSAGWVMEARPNGSTRRVAVYAFGPSPDEVLIHREAPRNGWKFGRVASVWDLGTGATV
jgi:hypothetical protein